MSDRGDVRHGVGLDENTGLPDVDWVTIPAGKFLYGLVEQTLRLAEYQIARYPITNIQFQSFVDSGDYDDPYWWNGFLEKYRPWTPHKRDYKYDNHPRGYLSWHQTISFCRWLTSRWQNLGVIADDEQVRLPTEQEWEKAARGTDGRKYPWGDTYIAGHANIDETKKYRRGSFALYGTDRYDFSDAVGPYFLNKPTAVGMYPHGKSVYGVLDTIGNGSEWCTTDALDHDHTGEGGGSGRVLRSCDFHSRYDSATCYHRSKLFPDPTLWDAKLGGFRIVLSPILDSL